MSLRGLREKIVEKASDTYNKLRGWKIHALMAEYESRRHERTRERSETMRGAKEELSALAEEAGMTEAARRLSEEAEALRRFDEQEREFGELGEFGGFGTSGSRGAER